MKLMKIAVLLALLAANCFGANWQQGTLTIYPTVTKAQEFTGNTYRDDQSGYTCYGGDSNHAPDCYKSSGLNVAEIGHSVATLADGEQFLTRDYQPLSVYVIPFDDAGCFNGQASIEQRYDCTIFRQLTLWKGGFLTLKKEPQVYPFKYKLGKEKKVRSGCLVEITVALSEKQQRKGWLQKNKDCK